MSHENFKRVFSSSGLSKSELAYIYQVSRQTIYDWLANDVQKNSSSALRFGVYTDAICKALDRGALPLPKNLTKVVRKQRIFTISTQLHGLAKPAQPR